MDAYTIEIQSLEDKLINAQDKVATLKLIDLSLRCTI